MLKEYKLWVSLTGKEKQEANKYVLKCVQFSITKENIRTTVGEVYPEIEGGN